MRSYVRMHAKTEAPSAASSASASETAPRASEMLFEIVGYPHFVEGDDSCKCFYAAAKMYPTRNAVM